MNLRITPGEPLRLMSVHAHPDDESNKGAATLAKYAAEGVDVLVVTCTGGERGDVLNPAMDRPGVRENLAAIRRAGWRPPGGSSVSGSGSWGSSTPGCPRTASRCPTGASPARRWMRRPDGSWRSSASSART
ncbi:hypothetical protein GCM10023195_59960 [Actinoallomurus liliacearum]|uniref:Uncharacterized protein n=1 Tax=Actinoallomurus liliacearum TaxID=1080073 RepID=A0ABP8TSV3_9ACTN